MSSGGIAPKAYACVGRFDELCQLLPESDDSARPTLIDQLGRFKIWAGNIGAFQELPTPSSLEHRLREAPKISAQVAEFLDDLEETLHEVLSIVSGDQPNRVNSSQDAELEDTTTEDRDEAASVESSQSQTSSELEELLRSSGDTITSLFKLSVLIRTATTRDRYAKAAKSQGLPFDPHFDTGHVGHKFPRIHQTSWLEKRLGKAMTQRRLFLRYCRQHRDRLGIQHMSKSVIGNAIGKDSLASALGEGSDDISQAAKSHLQSTKAPSTQAITTASTLIVNNLDRLDDISDELQSQTSYVTSANENDSSCIIRIPPIPDEGVRGLPFECPYCWNPQLIRNRREWKRHLLHDLKPYVCTFEECDLKMFADRRSWFHHEMQAHRVEWCCPFCSNVPFSSFKSFENHLQGRHAQTFPNDQLRALAETCQQSVNKIPPQDCPFCVEWSIQLRDIHPGISEDSMVVTPAQFQHHVGSHMEQLALFALPRNHVDAIDSTGAAASHGEKSDSSFGPQASFAKRDNPPLHVAAFEGLEAETLCLLRDGAMVDSAGKTWGDALTAAVAGRHASVVELLLDHGATFSGASSYGFEAILLATENGDKKILHILRESAAKTSLKEQVGSEFVDEFEETLPITTEHLVSDAKEDGNSLSPSIDSLRSPQKYLETVATQAYPYPQDSSIELAGKEKSEFWSRDGEPTPESNKSVFEFIINLTGASIRMDKRLRALAPHEYSDALTNLISRLELMTGTLIGITRQFDGDVFMVIVPDLLKPILLDIHRTLEKLDLFLKEIPMLQDGRSSWRESGRDRASITSSRDFAQVESFLKASFTDLTSHYRKLDQRIAISWMPLEVQGWIFDQLKSVEDLAGDTSPMQNSPHPLIDLLVGLHSCDSENTIRLPHDFLYVLRFRINFLLEDSGSRWYKDTHTRQSLEAYLKASLERSFWKCMDYGSIDHLLLFFAACAAHVVNKATLLNGQLWRPIVNEQLANFMSLIIATLEKHRDRPVFDIHLNRLAHIFRTSTSIDGNIGVSKKLHGSNKEGNDGAISTKSEQSFGPSAPEGYRYQCSDCTGRRKALLIGIESSEIQNTFAILPVIHRYGKEDIVMLSSQPTKRVILSAMTWLVKDAQTNDSLFFQYSGPAGQSRNLDTHGRPTFDDVIFPIDFRTAGHITNYEIFQIMVQPLRPGVRLTAIFDGFYKASPLNVAYINSARAVLAGADFRTKASQSVTTQVSSNARKLLRAMSSSKSLEAPELPSSDIQDLSRVTGTSPADVVVFHSARHAGLDSVDPAKWSTASTFFHVYRPHRHDSYAELLSNMNAHLPLNSTINHLVSCCHPLDMNKRFIM